MQTTAASTASWALWLVTMAVALVVAIGAFVAHKGRRLPGDHVFRASRLSAGNHLFPSQVIVTSGAITLYTPRWIGKIEESIHMAHVASTKITTHLVFADVSIETTSGEEPVECHGHTKRDAMAMKAAIEGFQSDYYRSEGPRSQSPSVRGTN